MIEQGNKKTMGAWAFYDWANSAYPLVITTAIFPIFYNEVTKGNSEDGLSWINFLGHKFINTELYSYVLSASFLVVIFLSPILSGIADYSGKKKQFMQLFCYLGAAACASLYFFDEQQLELSMISPFVASIGFWGSLVFYNAYLPEIAAPKDHDRLSAKGFSLGYIGSVLLLMINLLMVMKYEWFGFSNSGQPTRISFLMVAFWWAGFAQYTFRYLPKNPYHRKKEKRAWHKGFEELNKVYKEARQDKTLIRFLLSFFIYSMGVQTIMQMAQFFGIKEVYRIGENGEIIQGLETSQLIIAIILVQIIAIPGAFVFSFTSSKLGNFKTLMVALGTWIAICVGAFLFVDTPLSFFMAAAAIGFVMGGTQSLSRSTYAKILPVTKDHASFFSFYDVLEKGGIVIGMAAFGFIEGWTGSMRNSILSLIVFFIIGLIVLRFVPNKKEVSPTA